MAGSHQNDDYEITGINVTPLVDVMLVLLVIFMVTATYIVKEAIQIDLPRAASAGETTGRTLQIVVTKDGKTYVDGVVADDVALVRTVAASAGKREDIQAMISADRESTHGAVVHVLDVLKGQGVVKFAIQIEKEKHP